MNLSDDGYLVTPTSDVGKYLSSFDVVRFAQIEHYPCLCLLGEPGMGKTFALNQEFERMASDGTVLIRHDLRAYGSEDRLVRALFESREVSEWSTGDHILTLFLDSLDECLLRLDNLAALLTEELRKFPIQRLRLRIACRTAEWPATLEASLQQLWGADAIGVFELAPLTKTNVAEAASAYGFNPNQFLQTLELKQVVALAIRPVTLRFLLNVYSQQGDLPTSQSQLYRAGCRLLCEDTEGRRDARRVGVLSAPDRLLVAARIAAVTVFGNKYAIWTGVDAGQIPQEDVSLGELTYGLEMGQSGEIRPTDKILREVLGTGLFTSRGLNRMGWAHQTYAEFLAAYYLVEKGLSPSKIMSLIRHPDDQQRRLVPQLHQVASWLAVMVAQVWREVMRTDPEVLLRSDFAALSNEDKSSLVHGLLHHVAAGDLIDTFPMHGYYKKLAHPDLAAQLKPWICDRTKGIVVRRVAIDITETCGVNALDDTLADLALDESEDLHIRTQAGFAVSQMGRETSRKRLRPLALGQAGEDPDDELKGCGLLATWSDFLTAEELFQNLTPPKRESFLGIYQGLFLRRELVDRLSAQDFPIALRWVQRWAADDSDLLHFRSILHAVLERAWPFIDRSDVLVEYARAVFVCLLNHIPLPDDMLNDLRATTDKRHAVVRALVAHALQDSGAVWVIRYGNLVLPEDVFWIIDRVGNPQESPLKAMWIKLLQQTVNLESIEQQELLYYTSTQHPELVEAFPSLLRTIRLHSEEARIAREEYDREKKLNRPVRPKKLVPLPPQRIAGRIEAYENGNLDAWWIMNLDMNLTEDSSFHGTELESDLTDLPGWKAADTHTRQRIVAIAKDYLFRRVPEPAKWLGTYDFFRPDFSGYRALQLLLKEDPISFSTLPADVWKAWAPVVIAYPLPSNEYTVEPHHTLALSAYRFARPEILSALSQLIDRDNEQHDHIGIHHRLDGIWDEHLINLLLAKVQNPVTKPNCMAELLAPLLRHDVSEARKFAEALVVARSPRALAAAVSLATHTTDAGWSIIWPVVVDDTDFGKAFVLEISSRTYDQSVPSKLNEDQLADLFVWLVIHFPYDTDPKHDGAHWVGPRESVASWRDAVLRALKTRASVQACEALERVAIQLPQYEWLKWTLLEARALTRQATWSPPVPQAILEVAQRQAAYLLQSGHDLLELLLSLLERLQDRLQGETPAAIDLWSVIPGRGFRPKDENELSNYIKRYLQQELAQAGIVVNREVEIRRGYGPTSGDRVDILVEAAVRPASVSRSEARDPVSVIIEVKGSWHPDLNTAMKDQLRDRYMKDSRIKYGLYLVGWFVCPQWDSTDSRRPSVSSRDYEETQKWLGEEAARLSTSGMQIASYVLDFALDR